MKRWFIEYSTPTWSPMYIVIHAETKADARAMLKKHLQGGKHTVKRIEEWRGPGHETH